MLDSLRQDVRLGARALAKSPGFTFIALLTLALGIGANTTIFTALNAVLLRTLPIEDPRGLVILSDPESHQIGVGDGAGVRSLYAYSEFEDLRDHNGVFAGTAAVDSRIRKLPVSIDGTTGRSEGESAAVSMVSGDYFRVLGIHAYRGRTFGPEVDRTPHAHPIAVISHDYWKNRLALDGSILGRRIRIRQTVFEIVGVAQPGFSGETVGVSADVWAPLSMQNEVFPAWTNFLSRPTDPLQKILWLQVIARLKPGVTREAAEKGINLTATRLREAEAPALRIDRRREYLDSRIRLIDGSRGANILSDGLGEPLKILMAAVGAILLIACANIANLVLIRGAKRRREIALRLALGAGRGRVFQQLAVENLLLAIAGGAAGLFVAQWAGPLLVKLVSTEALPIYLDVGPDARVLGFSMAVSILAGVLFGMAPGLQSSAVDLNVALKGAAQGAMGFGGRPGKLSTPKLLVVAQIALSFSLLVAAGLFLQSFRKLDQVDPGFDHDHLLEFNISFLEASGYKGEAIHRVHREMLTRLAAIPQVRGATLAFMGLFVGNDMGSHISIDGSTPKPDPANLVRNDFVPAHHFAAIGQRLLMGREFTAEDERSAQLVGIVDQRLATKFFGEANPLGKTIRFDHDHPRDFVVIGVVANAKHNSLRERDDGEFWLPFFNASGDEPSSCTFQVRYTGSDAPVAAAIRAAVKDVAPAVGPIEIQTMNRLMSATLIAERAVSDISSAFGFIALLLAAIGLYGVMYHSLTARMTELGIRLALGARPGQILRAVLGETVVLIVAGVAAGVPLLLAVKGWLSSQLFGLTAFDPTIVGVAICVLTASTALAGYVPARWASRVDPMVTLHYE